MGAGAQTEMKKQLTSLRTDDSQKRQRAGRGRSGGGTGGEPLGTHHLPFTSIFKVQETWTQLTQAIIHTLFPKRLSGLLRAGFLGPGGKAHLPGQPPRHKALDNGLVSCESLWA